MKQYTIGLITGALLAISVMMFMGADAKDNEVGRYQISTTATHKAGNINFIFQTIFDTETGKIIDRKELHGNDFE